MTPGEIITLVKDVIILIALGLLIWLLITFGKDLVKVQDMKDFQKQLQQNTALEAKWHKDQIDANDKHDRDLQGVTSAIAQQRAPVLVCHNAAPKQLPANPPSAGAGPTQPGPVDPGPRVDSEPTVVDIRPQLNRFEVAVEKIVADCRRAVESWPSP